MADRRSALGRMADRRSALGGMADRSPSITHHRPPLMHAGSLQTGEGPQSLVGSVWHHRWPAVCRRSRLSKESGSWKPSSFGVRTCAAPAAGSGWAE
ncbi:hypothetical protein GUJ93_ZPchr0004g38747 [Zizania palustris]|uniref:Uncharacterized protein n=1 Tax=Zizania palustris TaxID=103762 RepID=A0A8J5VFK0_ZIZPA|nr:hypothetical protein GUJ93_ZPchr0004g38747 [Zizania palustris]